MNKKEIKENIDEIKEDIEKLNDTTEELKEEIKNMYMLVEQSDLQVLQRAKEINAKLELREIEKQEKKRRTARTAINQRTLVKYE